MYKIKIKNKKPIKSKLKLTHKRSENKYHLSSEQIDKIAARFYNKEFRREPSSESPTFYFVGGAIGSGKTRRANNINNELTKTGKQPVPIIDRDVLRTYHPNYHELKKEYPTNWVRKTDDVLKARDRILKRAARKRKSFIMETTLATPGGIKNLAYAKNHGKVIIDVVSVDPLVSKTKAFIRYMKKAERIDAGEKNVEDRYENNNNLDRVLKAQEEIFNQIEKSFLADEINFYDYEFKIMCSVSQVGGKWQITGGELDEKILETLQGKSLYEIYRRIGETTKQSKLEEFIPDLVSRYNTFKKNHPKRTIPIKEIGRFIDTELNSNK